MTKKEYDTDLKKRQEEHLKGIEDSQPHQPCMHDDCPECIGTGVKSTGEPCVHMISCCCPKCTPSYKVV